MQTVMLWIKMWTKSRRRLPTYLLVGESGLNVVHACSLFLFLNFFFFFWEKNEYKTCLPMVMRKWGFQSWSWILDMLPRGPRIWILDVLPRGLRIGILDVLPRGPLKLNFGRAFQRSKYLKFGCASQRPDGFVEGDICANVYGSFTLVPAK